MESGRYLLCEPFDKCVILFYLNMSINCTVCMSRCQTRLFRRSLTACWKRSALAKVPSVSKCWIPILMKSAKLFCLLFPSQVHHLRQFVSLHYWIISVINISGKKDNRLTFVTKVYLLIGRATRIS